MSQAQIIYDYLAQSGNPAADELLNLALKMSEEPYKSAIFETIIDRGRSRSSADIVSQYHNMDKARQALIVQRAADLYAPISQALTANDDQSRKNAIEIISQSRDCRLGEALVLMLKSGIFQLASKSAKILAQMVDDFVTENPYWFVDSRSNMNYQHKLEMHNRRAAQALSPRDKRQYLLTALKEALDVYNLHKRTELIPAAMMITGANDEVFWKFSDTITTPLTESVLNIVAHDKRAKMAYFVCSSLKVPRLRPMAINNISGKHDLEFVSALASAYSILRKDSEIVRRMKMIKTPQWLNIETVSLNETAKEQQKLLIDLIDAIGADPTVKAGWAYNSMPYVHLNYIFSLIGIIANPKNKIAVDMLKNINMSSNEDISFESLKHLIFLKPPELLTIVGRNLKSPHEKVRELATRVYQKGAFDLFWKKFERLDHVSQQKAAKAIFKLTEENHQRWEQQAQNHDPAIRLKALKVLKSSGLQEEHINSLLNMISDRDPFVRSLAVSLIGQTGEMHKHAEEVLLQATNDRDPRVLANAIEGLDFIHSKRAIDIALQHTESNIPRVRANAIRVLIHNQVENAWIFFKNMLGDKRPGHMKSAKWLLEKSGLTKSSSKNK